MQKNLKVRLAVLCVLAMVVSNIGGLIPGYARAGAIDDGQIVNDLGGAVNSAGEAVSLTADCVDEFGDPVSAQYENLTLPEFSGSLILDDPANPPFNHVKKREGLLGFLFPTEYTYVQASLNGEIIKELKREKVSVDNSSSNASASDATLPDASASNASSTAYSYFYKTGTSSWLKVEKDAAIQFEYMSGTKKTYTYEDDDVLVTATLQKKNALPENVKLKVTPVTAATPGYNYDAYMGALNKTESVLDPVYTAKNTLLYDIAFLKNADESGNSADETAQEYEPAEGTVKISISFKQKQLSEDIKADETENLKLNHLPLLDSVKGSAPNTQKVTDISADDIQVEAVDEKAVTKELNNVNKIDFSTTSLSVYSITSGEKQVNTWSGNTVFTSADIIDKLGWATDFSVVANEMINTSHIEGNVAVSNFTETQGGAGGPNQNARIYSDTGLTSITVSKEVTDGTDGTFNFGIYSKASPSDTDTTLGSFSITTKDGSGSASIDQAGFPEVFTALNSQPVYIFELDQYNHPVANGNYNDSYNVSYTTTDSEGTETDGNQISHSELANYIGVFNPTCSDNTLNQTYFGPAGTKTYFGSGSVDANWDGNDAKIITANGTAVKVQNYKNLVSKPTDDFKIDTGITSKINDKLSELAAYSVSLADAKNGSSGSKTLTDSPVPGALNVINLTSSTGNLLNDLSNAHFYNMQNGQGFIQRMLSDPENNSEFLLVNIDAGSYTSYQLCKLVIDGYDPNQDHQFSRMSSHVIYNLVRKNSDGTFSPYTGSISNPNAVIGGTVLAPLASVEQHDGLFGELIVNKLDRTGTGSEIHKVTLTGKTRSVTLNVENINPSALRTIKVKKVWSGKTGSSAVVHLYADGKDTGSELTLNSDNNWQGKFSGLAILNASGGKIKYTILEDPIDGYSSKITGYAGTGFTVTNTYNPAETTSPASTTGSTGGGGGGGGGTSTTAASTTKAQESSSTVPGETTSPYNGGGGRSPRGSGRVQSLTNIGNGDVPLYGYNPDGTEIPGMEIPRGNLGLPKTGEETTDSAIILLILSLIVGAGAALAGIIRKHSAARG